eukprot:scaffold8619_cov52-Phaeocystis_antarctica.AAC.6
MASLTMDLEPDERWHVRVQVAQHPHPVGRVLGALWRACSAGAHLVGLGLGLGLGLAHQHADSRPAAGRRGVGTHLPYHSSTAIVSYSQGESRAIVSGRAVGKLARLRTRHYGCT